ncbi:hypothetical protein M0Q97_08145 [Candidatus Dojkabacteria bacterium]|jgi:hypothetical protein|nr:hypothetical protein [Candidatus Dojkabacteria bacterium]
MKYLLIYIIFAIIWATYCAYRTSKFGTLGKMFKNQYKKIKNENENCVIL